MRQRDIIANLRIIQSMTMVKVGDTFRDKKTFRAYRMRKATWAFLTMSGYAYADDTGHVRITDKGYHLLVPPKKTSKDYYAERLEAGYIRQQLWVHEDDLEAFKNFVRRELRT